jgi:hypothetical protein
MGRPAPAFEQNVGQVDPAVRFRAKALGYGLLLADSEAVLTLGRGGATVRMSFPGAQPRALRGEAERAGRVHYVSLAAEPVRVAGRFERVRYVGAWPGIDVVFHGTEERQVRFDFELAPGADPGRIRLDFTGADRLSIDERGSLALALVGETLALRKPLVFQEAPDGRRVVEGRFVADSARSVRIALGDYDRALPLVIDPTIEFASYLGTGADEEVVWTESRGGSVYVSGRTWDAPAFPAVPGNPGTDPDAPHCFVSKFLPDGTNLAWSLVFDGAGVLAHECGPFALGPNAKVHAAVRLAASGGDWGVAVFTEPDSPAGYQAASFVVPELQPDQPVRVQADDAGNTYLLGSCNPGAYRNGEVVLPNGERTTAHLTDCSSTSAYGNPPRFESLLLKLDPSGGRLWGAFVGGTPPGSGDTDRLPDVARALAVDPQTQEAWVGGQARSADLAGNPERALIDASLHPPLHTSCGEASPGNCMPNAFVLRYDTTAAGTASLTYATYYGIRFGSDGLTPIPWDGTLADWFSVEDMALEPGGGINLFGTIRRVRQANQPYDLFVVRLDPWSPSDVFDPLWVEMPFEKVIAGSQQDTAVRIARRPNGDLVLGGFTNSPDFPQVDPLYPAPVTALTPFVSVVRPTDGTLLWSTVLPGVPPAWPADPSDPTRKDLSVSAAGPPDDGVVYAAWTTRTADLAAGAAGPFQAAFAGGADAVVARLCFDALGCSAPPPLNSPPTFSSVATPVQAPLWVAAGGRATLEVAVEDLDNDPLTVTWSLPSGTQTDSATSGSFLYASDLFPPGISSVTVTVEDGRGGVATAVITVEVVENTPVGAGVRVWPGNESSPYGGGAVVTITGDVLATGSTFLSLRNDVNPRPPADRQLGSPPYYYDLRTTATFAAPPTVCIDTRGHSFAHPSVAIHRHDGGAWTALASTVVETTPGFPQICAPVALGATPTTLAILTPEVPANRIRRIAGSLPWDWSTDECLDPGPGPDPNEDGQATNSRLHRPEGAVYDPARNALYFTETCGFRVRRLDLGSGTIHTLTGTGYPSQSARVGAGFGVQPTDGDAVSSDPALATLNRPTGVALDPSGNLYIADAGHCRIRKLSLDPSGRATSIVTVAGTGTCGYSGDGGPARAAQLGYYLWIRTDAAGNLYVSDYAASNYGGGSSRVRRIGTGGDGVIDGTETITTVAGGGTTEPGPTPAPPTSLAIGPLGLALAPSGDLYVGLISNSQILRVRADADGRVDGTAGETAALVRPPFRGYTPLGDSLALLPNGDILWGSSGCRGSSWPSCQYFGRVNRRTAGADGVVDGSADEVEDAVGGYDDWAALPFSVPRDFDGDGHALSARVNSPVTIVPFANGSFVYLDNENGQVRLVGSLPGATANQPPLADAGPSYAVVAGDRAILDGSASSDPEGGPLTYRWTLVSRPPTSSAELVDATSVTALLVPDRKGIYRARLVVNDGVLDSAPAFVDITAVNRPPVANAGPDRTLTLTRPPAEVESFALDGSGSSDPDGDSLTYAWTILTGPPHGGALAAWDTARPAFAPVVPGTFVVQLTVSDGASTSTDTATVIAVDPAPAVDAGPDRVVHLGGVTLDGVARDPNGGTIQEWSWTLASKPAGSAATLSGDTTSSASFLADKVGRYEVRVVVRDENSWSLADTVVIDATNTPPVARAGPDQSFTTFGGFVDLNGSASSDADPEDTIVQWNWWLVSAPSGSTATLGRYDTPRASLSADGLGTYVIRLAVFDGWAWSTPDEVVVTFANRPPVAAPDTATSVAGNAVVIDVLGNDSDPEGDEFDLTTATPPAHGSLTRLEPPAVPATRFLYRPEPGFSGTDTFTYTITTVVGGALLPSSATGTVSVNVSANRPPFALPDAASVAEGGSVEISVLANDYDPDGDTFGLVTVSGATLGTAGTSPPFVSYQAFTGASGTDTFTYAISDLDPYDGRVKSTATGTIRVTVGAASAPNTGFVDTPFGRITVTSPAGTVLGNLAPGLLPASPAPPRGVSFPYGLIGFTVSGVVPGATIPVSIELPGPVNDYWKLANNAWVRMTSATFSGNVVVLNLTDGGMGDTDGLANGLIIDPGAAGVAPPTTTTLMVSDRPNRSGAVALDGRTLYGRVFVFAAPASGIARVRYWLDNPGTSRATHRTEPRTTFEIVRSALPGSWVLPLPTRLLRNGPHVLTAEVQRRDGVTEVVHAGFVVKNEPLHSLRP